MSPAPRLVVVAGLVQGRAGTSTAMRYLLTRRPARTHLGGSWEFPGGKLEPGEAPVEALHRELLEEVGITVTVGDIFAIGHHRYPEREILLLVYSCQHQLGEPAPLQVAELRWLTLEEVIALPLPPADQPVVERLRRERAATP